MADKSRSVAHAVIGLIGSVLGLLFASYSTFDYAQHLDRRLHDIHCSFIPGAPVTDAADACRAAMYSPYSALLKERYWGGVPISLFAVGAFCFFVGFSLYLLLARGMASPKQTLLYGLTALTPLMVSAVMATISATKLGSFCKTCVGIYISSTVLAIGAVLALVAAARMARQPGQAPAVSGAWLAPLASLVGLGLATLAPALAYAASVPDHRPFLGSCGTLKKAPQASDALLSIKSARSVQPAVIFEDPLCPTCKGFHQRLVIEGMYDRLDVQLALFPLDSECNWMLDQPLHPGACAMARAVICGKDRALQVLEWAYENQEAVSQAAKVGKAQVEQYIGGRWGQDVVACMKQPATTNTLTKHLHFAVDNSIPVSTPQLYLGDKRLCDEDIDIGLRFTMSQLAPEVVK